MRSFPEIGASRRRAGFMRKRGRFFPATLQARLGGAGGLEMTCHDMYVSSIGKVRVSYEGVAMRATIGTRRMGERGMNARRPWKAGGGTAARACSRMVESGIAGCAVGFMGKIASEESREYARSFRSPSGRRRN